MIFFPIIRVSDGGLKFFPEYRNAWQGNIHVADPPGAFPVALPSDTADILRDKGCLVQHACIGLVSKYNSGIFTDITIPEGH